MTPRLTVYFIVEPPAYQVMACYLAASLREQFGDTVALVGYCPQGKLADIHPDVTLALSRMGCDIRPFATQTRFDPPYPHGNKILATLEKRDTEFSCFMDSDILCLRPNKVENITREGRVSLTPAASMGWARQNVWPGIYALFGMDLPDERIQLMNQAGSAGKVPYFSSGLFSFPEQYRTPGGQSFPEVWMETAQVIDAGPDVPGKRPYLDQISLPIAIQRAGLAWNLLPDGQHFILGGKRARDEPLPGDREIFTVHYRQWPLIKALDLAGAAKQMLIRQAGMKKVALKPKAGEPDVEAAADGAESLE